MNAVKQRETVYGSVCSGLRDWLLFDADGFVWLTDRGSWKQKELGAYRCAYNGLAQTIST